MSIQFSAPYPLNQTTSILPSPDWNDSYNLKDEVTIKRAVNGALYTYVKHQNHRRRLLFSVKMTFHKAYYASRIYVKDWLNNEWVGYAVNSPFEFTTDEAGGGQSSRCPSPAVGSDYTSIQFEFEVVPKGYEDEL
jgi:hypothetical protein